jgi:hypothetical protein
MAGYLDQYGVADKKRESAIKKFVLIALAVLIVGGGGYLYFRTWSQERVVKSFLEALSRKDYPAAYKMWGCTPESPCKFYGPDKFDEDWGPKSAYANAAAAKMDNVEYCDASGVLVNLSFPGAEPVALYVDRQSDVISFAPWPQCPGRRWQFKQFFQKLFS